MPRHRRLMARGRHRDGISCFPETSGEYSRPVRKRPRSSSNRARRFSSGQSDPRLLLPSNQPATYFRVRLCPRDRSLGDLGVRRRYTTRVREHHTQHPAARSRTTSFLSSAYPRYQDRMQKAPDGVDQWQSQVPFHNSVLSRGAASATSLSPPGPERSQGVSRRMRRTRREGWESGEEELGC